MTCGWLRNGGIGLAALALATTVAAQNPGGTIRKRNSGADAPAADKPAGRPAEVDANKDLEQGAEKFVLETDDGVFLSATYFRPKNTNNNTPVVVLLHGRGQTQRDWYPFAQLLANPTKEGDPGFAVVTFDFRGHGESRDVDPTLYKRPKEYIEAKRERKARDLNGDRVVPQGSRAAKEKLAEKSKKRKSVKSTTGDRIDEKDEFKSGDEITRFCSKDVETIKRFLLQHHNAGEFNVRNLGIVGAEMGASVAVRWMSEKEFMDPSRNAWSITGGDLHALVLVTPQWNYGGYTLSAGKAAGKSKIDEVGIMIVSGNDPKSSDGAMRSSRLFNVPEVSDNDPKKPATTVRGRAKGSMALKVNSKLVGTKLFNPPVAAVDEKVVDFLKGQLSDKKTRGWEKREIDLDSGGFGSAASGTAAPPSKKRSGNQ